MHDRGKLIYMCIMYICMHNNNIGLCLHPMTNGHSIYIVVVTELT